MGNDSNFCCDHSAQFDLFQSKKKMGTILQQNNQFVKVQPQRLRRMFSKDNFSIIDELDIRSEIQKDDRPKSNNLLSQRSTHHFLQHKQNCRPNNKDALERQKELKREREWYQYKFKELEQEKKKQRQIIKKQLEQDFRKYSLKDKKNTKQQKVSMVKRKSFDFQFVVNYR